MLAVTSTAIKIYRYLFVLPPAVGINQLRYALLALLGRGVNQPVPLPHPIDAEYGIDTSGNISSKDLRTGAPSDLYNTSYSGSQPSIIRKALSVVPDLHKATFFDLGCGKGRALAVASEFPFRRIVGVELCPAVAAVARANAEVLRRRFPARTPITIIEGDAATTPLPPGPVVVYFYHPFFRGLMKRVLANIERGLATEPGRPVHVVYYNPVDGDLYDKSRRFQRLYAANLEFAPEELGTGPNYHNRGDCVVVWQTDGPDALPAHPRAKAPIRIDDHGWRAQVITG